MYKFSTHYTDGTAIYLGSENTACANSSGMQGICPTGWHVPSYAEWTELTTYLGGTGIAGGKMKETGTIHWNSPNRGATNERYGNDAYTYYLKYNYDNVYRSAPYKTYGYSVRCVKD